MRPSWWTLGRRLLWARRRGLAIRVQVDVSGHGWMRLWSRREAGAS